MHNDNQIIMLGTGNAMAMNCYNTCFLLKTPKTLLLVDAGGGNGILSQLAKTRIEISDLHNMFITHAHTDHILGAVWILRMVIQRIKKQEYEGFFNVFGNEKVLSALQQICALTLSPNDLTQIGQSVRFYELYDQEIIQLQDIRLQCFDIHSTKEMQFGFRAILPNGISVVCLGDEPFNEANKSLVENADWLLCEAFCLYKDRDVFHPYEKHHSTAMEAGLLASKLNVKNLLLYHTEDKTLSFRKVSYAAEASLNFNGNIVVPDDLENILLDPIAGGL